jgi:hypothetical protein
MYTLYFYRSRYQSSSLGGHSSLFNTSVHVALPCNIPCTTTTLNHFFGGCMALDDTPFILLAD